MNGSSGSSGFSAYDADADYAALDEHARAIFDCWFGAPGSATFGKDRKLWFARDAAFDAMLRERFGGLLEAAGQGALDAWAHTPLGALALVRHGACVRDRRSCAEDCQANGGKRFRSALARPVSSSVRVYAVRA
jgi:hypothetical protein